MTRRLLTRILMLVIFSGLAVAQESNSDRTELTLERLQEQVNALQSEIQRRDDRETHLMSRIDRLEQDLRDGRGARLAVEADPFAQKVQDLAERVELLEDSGGASSALSVGGYFDFEIRNDQAASHPEFDQHRLILQFDADILKDAISFRSEIEFEGGGAGASFLSGNQVLVEFAELHVHFDRAINFKAGALLVPFGRYNGLHDSPLRDLTDRPLVDRRLIPTTWTDAGLGVYGAFDIGAAATIDYDVIFSQGLDDDFSSTRGGGFRGNRNSFRADNNDNKMIIGRIGISPDIGFLDSANVGFSFGHGKYDDEDDQSITMFAVDGALKWGPLELIGEYATYDLERSDREVALGAPGGADGFYVQLNFHFFPESWRGMNKFFNDESTFTLVARYGTVDTDDSAKGIDRSDRGSGFRDDLRRWTFGINFRPIEKTVIKFEYQYFPEFDEIDDVANDRIVMSIATYF